MPFRLIDYLAVEVNNFTATKRLFTSSQQMKIADVLLE